MEIAVLEHSVILIVDEGEGKWSMGRTLACGVELSGFGGKNHLYVLLQSLQDGNYHVTVCHCRVDGSTKVRQELVKEAELASWINTLIAQTSPHKL